MRAPVLLFLACLASQLWPQAKAQRSAYYGTLRALYKDTCSSGFPTSPVKLQKICKEDNQCQGSCCFSAGYCTDSNNNNCLVSTPGFPPTQGTKASTNPSSATDGCFCNQTLTVYPDSGGQIRLSCNQTLLTGNNKCWGVVACTLDAPCDHGVGCDVRIVFILTAGCFSGM